MEKLLTLLNNSKNILVVLVAVVLGLLIPEIGAHLQSLVTPIVAFLVFTSIIDRSFESSSFRSYWKLLVIFLILSYGLIPVLGMFIIDLFLSDGARIGFGIMLAAPATAGSAIVWTRLSNGNVQFSTIASMLSLFVAPLFTPQLLDHLISSGADVPTLSILTDLVLILVGGVLMYMIFPRDSISAKEINLATPTAIMLLIYIGVSNSGFVHLSLHWIIQIVTASVLLSILVFSLVIAVKHLIGIPASEAVPLYYVTNMKNLGVSVLISVSYTEPLVLTTIISYYVVQQLVSATISEMLT